MEHLYLCRHGETEWTVSGQHTGSTDLSLTARGELQVLLLRERLQGVHFEKVFSSPLKRAVETCAGMGAVLDPLLVECNYGDYEGLKTREIQLKRPGWNLFTDGAPNGETPDDVAKRADQFLEKIRQIKGNVAIFSHGHFLRILTARFLGLTPEMGKLFSISVASVGILGYTGSDSKIGRWQGGALNLSQASDFEAAQPERLSDAERLKFSGCPTQPEPIFQSRAVCEREQPSMLLWNDTHYLSLI